VEEPTIEVRYAGTVVAKSAPARDQDANGFFLSVGEPMPVGTVLQLTVDQVTRYGRVEQVVESTESMQAGMRIRFVAAPAVRPAPVAAAAPAAVAVPAAPEPAAAAPVMPASIVDSAATTTGAGDDDAGGSDGEAPATPAGNGADPNPGPGGGGRRRRRRR
jgi:hypothetical protein